jgi:hypothetical protein
MTNKKDNVIYSEDKIKLALKCKFELNMSLKEISLRTDIPKEYIRKLLQGKKRNALVMEYLLNNKLDNLDF